MKKVVAVLFMTSAFALGQAPPPAAGESVAGKWVAEHRSGGGIGSMWIFRPDGTLTISLGAIVDEHYTVQGDKLTTPPDRTTPDAKPQVSTISWKGDQLCLTMPKASAAMCFIREGAANPPDGSEDARIVGTWKLDVPSAPAAANQSAAQKQQTEALRAANQNATWTFTPDGTLKLRIPFKMSNGSWDKAAQTFTVNYGGRQIAGKFRLEGGKLVLTQPDGHKEDTYVRDSDAQ